MQNQEILKLVNEIKEYANENKVPIVLDGGLEIIINKINETKSKKILEVGSAIGYCAINMALVADDIHVDTIERNEKMYLKAIENVKRLGLESRVHVFFADALEIDEALLQNDYDLIFVDAAKAQYIRFFEKFGALLRKEGLIISDNLSFHGCAQKYRDGEELTKDLKALMRKVNRFIDWLKANQNYETIFFDAGDGVAVSKKIN